MPATSKNGSALLGIGLLLISGLGFTSSLLIANMTIKNGIDVNTSNAMRYLFATVLLWAWHEATGNRLAIRFNPTTRIRR